MNDGRFLYVTFIRTTPEKIWDALTQPEFTRQYWVESYQESKWTEGADWKMFTPDGRVINTGRVLEIERPKKLVLEWQAEIFEDVKKEGASRATFTIEPVGDEVKLTVLFEMPKPNTKFIDMCGDGWPLVLSSLKSFLETGKPLESTAKFPKNM